MLVCQSHNNVYVLRIQTGNINSAMHNQSMKRFDMTIITLLVPNILYFCGGPCSAFYFADHLGKLPYAYSITMLTTI